VTALPVVVAPKQPLAFREWHPGVELAKGRRHPIRWARPKCFPTRLPADERLDARATGSATAAAFRPDLAGLAKKPVVIGVPTARKARYDPSAALGHPMDYVVRNGALSS